MKVNNLQAKIMAPVNLTSRLQAANDSSKRMAAIANLPESVREIATATVVAPTPLSKVLIDRMGAALALLALSPVFLVLCFMVKRDGGPAFYGQKRIGRNGATFKCWKFRSMVMNSAEILEQILATDPVAKAEYEADFKLKNDPRITKIGHVLRKTSLDELPQLWNVLVGEMSLVGPRPVTAAETLNYGQALKDYLSVRPGMTGLWQISGRNDVTYAERVQLDSEYVKTQSFWGDIAIMIKTVLVMLNRRGAY